MAAGKSQHAEYSDSLKGMRLELKNLTQEYDSLSKADRESADGLKLKDKIKDLTDSLKSAEEGTGRFYRNVGNYTNSIKEAFAQMGVGAKSVIPSINGLNVSMKALATNPIGAVLTALALIIKGLVSAFKRNEEATNSLKKALAPLQAALVVVQKAFDFLATSIGKAAEAVAGFFGKIFGGSKDVETLTEKIQDISDKELKLAQQQRETLKQNADAEAESAELRAKAAEKNKYTASERLEFLKQAGEKEKEISQRAYEDLKLQYEIIKKKNSLTKSSAEDLKAEAEAYAAMINAKTAYAKKEKEINAQITEAINAQKQEHLAALNAQKSTIDAQLKVAKKGSDEEYDLKKKLIDKEYEITVQNAKNTVKNTKVLNAQLKALAIKRNQDLLNLEVERTKTLQTEENKRKQIEINAVTKGSSEYYSLVYELRKKEHDDIIKIGKLQNETDADYKLRVQASTETWRQSAIEYSNALREEKLNPWIVIATNAKEGSIEEAAALQKVAEMRVNYLEKDKKYLKTLGITEQEYELMIAEANKEYQHSIDETILRTDEATQRQLDNAATMATMEFGSDSVEAYNARLEAAQNYYDNLFQLQDESNEEFKARQMEAEQAITDLKAKHLQQQLNNYMELANGIGSIMGSIADFYADEIKSEVDAGKISEAEGERRFKQVKAMQIAVATINMLTGIATAISGLFTTETGPWDIALAAVQATAIAVSGGLQIAKIKQTNLGSSGSGGGGGSISAPSMNIPNPVMADYTPQSVSNVTGTDEMTTLANALTDKPIKAYVVESEISDAQHKARQREEESTF